MPRNVYSEINLHITWHTLLSAPMLTESIEAPTHRHLTHRALRSPGVRLHAIGGMPDHVHLAVSVPPTLLIAEWIGELKGASTHHVNHTVARPGALAWQAGYGVVSFGTRDLEWVVRYIHNQREHHTKGTVFERLEQVRNEGEGPDA